MGTRVHACFPTSFLFYSGKVNPKGNVLALPQWSLPLLWQRELLHSSLGRLWLLPEALQEWKPLVCSPQLTEHIYGA